MLVCNVYVKCIVCTVHYCSTLIVQADVRVVKPVTDFDLVCIESLKGFCIWGI